MNAQDKDPARLIDRIYEAAVVPEHWPRVLDDLAGIIGGLGSLIMVTDFNRASSWIASDDLHQVITDWVSEGWAPRVRRTQRMIALRRAGFVTMEDVFSPEELAEDEEYRDFLRPRGLGSAAGSFIPMPTGEVAVYSIERRHDLPPLGAKDVARLDVLRPHLARAGTLATRLGLERARTASEAFSAIGLAAGALDSRGRLMAANGAFNVLVPQVFQDRGQGLRLSDPDAQALFAAALAAYRAGAQPAVGSIPLAGQGEAPPTIVHLLPVRRAAHDVFSNLAWLVVAVPVRPNLVPGASVLQALFDLTPAEARTAEALAAGRTIAELAEALGLSRETIRVQLKGIFAKTGVRRQADLVSLLAGKAVSR